MNGPEIHPRHPSSLQQFRFLRPASSGPRGLRRERRVVALPHAAQRRGDDHEEEDEEEEPPEEQVQGLLHLRRLGAGGKCPSGL